MTYPARANAPLPGPLRGVAIAAAAVLLTLLFVYWGFPTDRLTTFVEAHLSQATGARVAAETVRPSLHLAGPGVTASGVRAAFGAGDPIRIDELVLRPAWSFSWLRGRPALHVELGGPLGAADGTVTLGTGGGFAGDLVDVDLGALPVGRFVAELALEGRANAAVDLVQGLDGPEGVVAFEAREGSATLPGLPLALPFDAWTGDLRFGDETWVSIRSMELTGPLLKAEVTGSVGQAPTFQSAPLSIQIQATAEPGIRSALAASGLRLTSDGSTRIRITGTPLRPVVR